MKTANFSLSLKKSSHFKLLNEKLVWHRKHIKVQIHEYWSWSWYTCNGEMLHVSPNKQQSDRVASFMHSCIKSNAREKLSARAARASERRLTEPIVEVIKPINVVLYAAFPWVDCTLNFFCFFFFYKHQETDKIWTYCQLLIARF